MLMCYVAVNSTLANPANYDYLVALDEHKFQSRNSKSVLKAVDI